MISIASCKIPAKREAGICQRCDLDCFFLYVTFSLIILTCSRFHMIVSAFQPAFIVKRPCLWSHCVCMCRAFFDFQMHYLLTGLRFAALPKQTKVTRLAKRMDCDKNASKSLRGAFRISNVFSLPGTFASNKKGLVILEFLRSTMLWDRRPFVEIYVDFTV